MACANPEGSGGGDMNKGDGGRRFLDVESSSDEEGQEKREFKSGSRALLRTARAAAYHQLSPKASGCAGSTSSLPTSGSSQQPLAGDETKITLVVDDTRFVVTPSLFTAHPDTMLGRMFSSGFDFHPNSRGEFEVAEGVSASVFGSMLEYYQTGVINCPPHVSVAELREACDYFMLPFTAATVKCVNLRGLLHELSNDGAEEQFEAFLEELILPQMVSDKGLFKMDKIDNWANFPPGDCRFARRPRVPHCHIG